MEKIYKSKPEPKKGNVNAIYFNSSARKYSNQSPVAQSLFMLATSRASNNNRELYFSRTFIVL